MKLSIGTSLDMRVLSFFYGPFGILSNTCQYEVSEFSRQKKVFHEDTIYQIFLSYIALNADKKIMDLGY